MQAIRGARLTVTLPNDSPKTAEEVRTAVEAIVADVPGATVTVWTVARVPREETAGPGQ